MFTDLLSTRFGRTGHRIGVSMALGRPAAQVCGKIGLPGQSWCSVGPAGFALLTPSLATIHDPGGEQDDTHSRSEDGEEDHDHPPALCAEVARSTGSPRGVGSDWGQNSGARTRSLSTMVKPRELGTSRETEMSRSFQRRVRFT